MVLVLVPGCCYDLLVWSSVVLCSMGNTSRPTVRALKHCGKDRGMNMQQSIVFNQDFMFCLH